MRLYAFRQKSTGRLITGTDFRNGHKQIFNDYSPPLMMCEINLRVEMLRRRINPKYYDVVEVYVGIDLAGKPDQAAYFNPPKEDANEFPTL